MGPLGHVSGTQASSTYSHVTPAKNGGSQIKPSTISRITNLWIKANFSPEMQKFLKSAVLNRPVQSPFADLSPEELEGIEETLSLKIYEIDNAFQSPTSKKTQNFWSLSAHASPVFHGKAHTYPAPAA
jgi:hypothetical protein